MDRAEDARARGYDAGNFDAAYEPACRLEDRKAMWAKSRRYPTPAEIQAYEESYLLGFYSSYELYEIADDAHRQRVASLRGESL